MAATHITNRNRWTKHEEDVLLQILKKHKTNTSAFNEIATILGRSKSAVCNHHYIMMKRGDIKQSRVIKRRRTNSVNITKVKEKIISKIFFNIVGIEVRFKVRDNSYSLSF